ncbi:MAG: hypothetical protein WA955_06400 [Diaphorobacter nitroreducens]|uniref:hypothetical protein n=1 Tax=Diaphorobacter nitroreducens TaxID=164759 RepID=UPI003C7704EA
MRRTGQFVPDKALDPSRHRWPSSAEVIVMDNASQWVLIKRLTEITGYSENAVRRKAKNGAWMSNSVITLHVREIRESDQQGGMA